MAVLVTITARLTYPTYLAHLTYLKRMHNKGRRCQAVCAAACCGPARGRDILARRRHEARPQLASTFHSNLLLAIASAPGKKPQANAIKKSETGERYTLGGLIWPRI